MNQQQPQPTDPMIVTMTQAQLRQLVREEVSATVTTTGLEKLLTPEQLAEALSVPLSWVYEQSRQGRIPTHKIGHYSRFDLREVLTHLKAQKTTGN